MSSSSSLFPNYFLPKGILSPSKTKAMEFCWGLGGGKVEIETEGKVIEQVSNIN
jgi:hypothetical protein